MEAQVKRACGMALCIAPLASPTAADIVPLAADAAKPDMQWQREDWEKLEPFDLEDLVRDLSGILIARIGGPGSIELVNVLGSENGRIQVTIDGVDITSPELEWPNLQSVPLAAVERIDVTFTHEPARIAIWTRESTSEQPSADFDLSRGGPTERTRRVHFVTPPRKVAVGITYDERLRGDEDFRTIRFPPAPLGLGSMNQRSQLVR